MSEGLKEVKELAVWLSEEELSRQRNRQQTCPEIMPGEFGEGRKPMLMEQ